MSSQDYDVPLGVSPTSCRYNDDVDFGVGDYDLLTPPQRPASDVDCSASSNRSSVTSVMSGGSLSSGCASVRSAQSPSVYVGRSPTMTGARMNGCGLQSAPRRSVSEATSDSSADSGIALQTALNSPVKNNAASTVNGVSYRQNYAADDVDCLDYDVPVASVNGGAEVRLMAPIIAQRTASPQRQGPPSARHVSPLNSEELGRRNGAKDDRRRRVEELCDCVMRNVQRFLAWTGRAAGDAACIDTAAARQCHGQAKLAGLAVRTSLKELVAVVDGNPQQLLQRYVDPLNKSLFEIDRRLDWVISSGSEGRPHRLTESATGGRRAARESSACRDRLQAVAEIVADLPDLVRQFSDFVTTTPAIVVRPPDDFDVIPSSPPSRVPGKVLPPPATTQRKDSLQRERPPQSPPAVAGGGPRGGRPPLGKPPPVKPKPPKTVTWKRPPQSALQPRATGSPDPTTVNGTASRPNHDRQVTELNQKNGPLMDGWNEDDCDYVSIVRQVEREMESAGKRTSKNWTTPGAEDRRPSALLNDDDRELLAFYAGQISAHAADVDAASAEFYRCCPSPTSSPSVDAFVRRSRFVVLAAHRLVYVGDVIARHVTNQSVRDRVAAAANALCDRLKAVVMATRDAAVATADNENPAAVAGVRRTMMDSVRHATDDCRRLCDVISAISC